MGNRKIVFKIFSLLSIVVLINLYFYIDFIRPNSNRRETSSLFRIERNVRRNLSDLNSSIFNQVINIESEIPPHTSENQSCSESRSLMGYVKVNLNPPSMDTLEVLHSDLAPDGHYTPNCYHEDVIAIILPYRNRAEHLKVFLSNIHPILKRQRLEYNIFVVEQTGSEPFNRAMLFNIGYSESIMRYNFTCFIFHDVDLIPENDRNIYSCPLTPRHMSVAVDTMKYRLPYRAIIGGVAAFSKKDFILVNGFSNRYWGWGAEDDDMANRVAYHGLFVSRYPPDVGRYKMASHKKETSSFNRLKVLHKGIKRFLTDGLSNLNYTIDEITPKKLYTLIKVRLMRKTVVRPKG